MTDAPTLLVLIHVPWEAPHRILDACGALAVRTVRVLEGEAIPDHAGVSGVLAMGGPMNVDEVERHPGLAAEREWLAEAAQRGMPVLGVCLGAQLLARALEADVRPGKRAEIGFARVDIHDPSDPIVGALAPSTTVLHWHRDVFDLPDGARSLASSAQTPHQAFRAGNSWGVLFHPEADAGLVDAWLTVPEMAKQARQTLGEDGVAALPRKAQETEPGLIDRSTVGFRAFAELVETGPQAYEDGAKRRV